ncbi:MAG: hypothetical protein JNK04_05320, partial [Myxococcales bacterium]|nr:hypothetical protein [Myxococcales bacterium]
MSRASRSPLRLERAQSFRDAVALGTLAFFSASLLIALVALDGHTAHLHAGLGATVVAIATATYAVRVLRGNVRGTAPVTAILSLGATGTVGGLLASQIAGLSGVGLAVLVATWAPAAWLAPRRPLFLWLGISIEVAIFVVMASGAVGRPSVPLPELALMAAGLVVLGSGRLDLARRTSEDDTLWRKLETAQEELELRRAELESKSADLGHAAREQLDEMLDHAKTTEQLERLLAARVAGRSRQLAENVDRTARPRIALNAGAACGSSVVLGRMSPAPYQEC